MVRFAKRRDDSSATAPAPAPAALSIPSLQAELSKTRERIHQLAAEREALALASITGDAKALARIQAIDAQRAALVARDETLNAAIRTLQQEARATGWKHRMPRMQRQLKFELFLAWSNRAPAIQRLMLGHQGHDIVALREAVADLTELESRTAHEVADDVLPPVTVAGYMLGDAAGVREYHERKAAADEQRQQIVALAAQELLTMTKDLKRPQELEDVLVWARKRLEGAPRKTQGLNT